jgi:hypothetical protein
MTTDPIDWIERAKEYNSEDSRATSNCALIAIAEELRRMNERAEIQAGNVATCPHGATGLCMACVMMNDLLRPKP